MSDDANARFSLMRTVFWIVLCGLAFLMGWLNSVAFVSLLSIWALVETSWAAYRADKNKDLFERLDKIEKLLNDLSGQAPGKAPPSV